METEELLQSLSQLEENLQEISSANRLVQDTVDAYRAVEGELAPAVKALGELALEQKSLADGVQKRMDDALSLFAQDVKDIKEELYGKEFYRDCSPNRQAACRQCGGRHGTFRGSI